MSIKVRSLTCLACFYSVFDVLVTGERVLMLHVSRGRRDSGGIRKTGDERVWEQRVLTFLLKHYELSNLELSTMESFLIGEKLENFEIFGVQSQPFKCYQENENQRFLPLLQHQFVKDNQ